MTLASPDPVPIGPLTAKLGDLCSGPRCGNTVAGKARYCGQACRNNAHALHRIAKLFADMSDHRVLEILKAWRPS